MENIQLTNEEIDYILNLIQKLDTPHIKKVPELFTTEAKSISLDYISEIYLLLKTLSFTSIRNQEISLQQYKNLFIYMKNLIIMNQRYIKDFDIDQIIIKLILIMISPNIEYIQYKNMILLYIQLLKIICDNDCGSNLDDNKIKNYYNIIFNNINQIINSENFVIIAKNSLLIYSCFIETNLIGASILLDLLQKYILSICDIIFDKTKIYIIPSVKYDIQFIKVLKYMYKMIIVCLKKLKRFFPSIKRKEISDNIFAKYGRYSLDLIKLIPIENKDEIILNNILVFKEEYKSFNLMKSNIFQFLCIILENSLYDTNESNNENFSFNSSNKFFFEIIYELILFVKESFKQILDNEKIFLNLRKIDDERNDEENCYNMLLYNMIYFLAKSIIKEPIKAEFNKDIQLFLLNQLFPLLTTIENEYTYMNREPEEYCAYFNDLVYNLTLKNFRIAGLNLIKKICEYYEDVPNFIFSYIIGLMDDLLNRNENNQNIINNNDINIINNTQIIKYNIYEYYKSQNIFFNKFKDETKFDFCLLIIILLQNDLLKHKILKERLRQALIKSKNKFIFIKSILIKIKLCHFFKFVLPNLFNIDTKENNNEKNNENLSFIEMSLNFFFKNLKLDFEDSNDDEYLFSDSLRNEISNIIIYLCNFSENEDSILKQGINIFLQNEFHSLLNLIEDIQLYSFFEVIEQIIKSVTINNRKDIFICLEKLTKRFEEENETGDSNSQIYCPRYFSIISSFLTGVNKIQLDDINFNQEIGSFNAIYKPILDLVKNINSFLYYENFLISMTDYIKNIQMINEQSSFIIKIMPEIIEKDRQFSDENLIFLTTFLTYFNGIVNDQNHNDLFNIIISILDITFTFEFGKFDPSKLNSLLITMQLYNKNINIPNNISLKLISNSIKCFNYIFPEDENFGRKKFKLEKNNIIFGILSLNFIFNPEKIFDMLNEVKIVKKKEIGLYGEYEYEKFSFEKYVEILEYISIYEIDNELLRKCLILGFCSIMKEEKIKIFLDKNKNLKIKLVVIFAKFILIHKKQELDKRNKTIKNELKYSEIKINEDGKIKFKDNSFSEEEEEEEEENDEVIQNKLNTNINYILAQNIIIKNSDEYAYFKEILDDDECKNILKSEFEYEKFKELEDIYHTKKIKVNYQGKEFEIPRKILNIKKNK